MNRKEIQNLLEKLTGEPVPLNGARSNLSNFKRVAPAGLEGCLSQRILHLCFEVAHDLTHGFRCGCGAGRMESM